MKYATQRKQSMELHYMPVLNTHINLDNYQEAFSSVVFSLCPIRKIQVLNPTTEIPVQGSSGLGLATYSPGTGTPRLEAPPSLPQSPGA